MYPMSSDYPTASVLDCHDGSSATAGGHAPQHEVRHGLKLCGLSQPDETHRAATAFSYKDNAGSSFTGADYYVHGSPNFDGICETCHTATNHHYRSDGTAPLGQSHNACVSPVRTVTPMSGTGTAGDAFTDQPARISRIHRMIPHRLFDRLYWSVT